MKNKFLSICLGASAVIMSSAFLLNSVSTAQAEPTPKQFMAEGTSKIGRYQMELSRVAYPDNTSNVRIMIWDTETGKSVYWRLNPEDDGFVKMGTQLPADPMN